MAVMLQGQSFENAAAIKKSKKRAATAFATSDDKGTTVTYKNASFIFNEDGNLVTEYGYDASGKLLMKFEAIYKDGKLIESSKEKKKLNEVERMVYTYNKEGLLTKKSEYRNDKLIIYYQYYYGTGNRLDSIIWFDKTAKAQLYEYHQYEGEKLTEIIEKTSYGRLDGKTALFYNDHGVLKEEKLYDGFGEMYEHMTYNDKGLMIERKLIQDKKITTYTYDYSGKGLIKQKAKHISDNPNRISYTYKWSKKIMNE